MPLPRVSAPRAFRLDPSVAAAGWSAVAPTPDERSGHWTRRRYGMQNQAIISAGNRGLQPLVDTLTTWSRSETDLDAVSVCTALHSAQGRALPDHVLEYLAAQLRRVNAVQPVTLSHIVVRLCRMPPGHGVACMFDAVASVMWSPAARWDGGAVHRPAVERMVTVIREAQDSDAVRKLHSALTRAQSACPQGEVYAHLGLHGLAATPPCAAVTERLNLAADLLRFGPPLSGREVGMALHGCQAASPASRRVLRALTPHVQGAVMNTEMCVGSGFNGVAAHPPTPELVGIVSALARHLDSVPAFSQRSLTCVCKGFQHVANRADSQDAVRACLRTVRRTRVSSGWALEALLRAGETSGDGSGVRQLLTAAADTLESPRGTKNVRVLHRLRRLPATAEARALLSKFSEGGAPLSPLAVGQAAHGLKQQAATPEVLDVVSMLGRDLAEGEDFESNVPGMILNGLSQIPGESEGMRRLLLRVARGTSGIRKASEQTVSVALHGLWNKTGTKEGLAVLRSLEGLFLRSDLTVTAGFLGMMLHGGAEHDAPEVRSLIRAVFSRFRPSPVHCNAFGFAVHGFRNVPDSARTRQFLSVLNRCDVRVSGDDPNDCAVPSTLIGIRARGDSPEARGLIGTVAEVVRKKRELGILLPAQQLVDSVNALQHMPATPAVRALLLELPSCAAPGPLPVGPFGQALYGLRLQDRAPEVRAALAFLTAAAAGTAEGSAVPRHLALGLRGLARHAADPEGAAALHLLLPAIRASPTDWSEVAVASATAALLSMQGEVVRDIKAAVCSRAGSGALADLLRRSM